MSILQLPHASPDIILIDWHATLVDTHDAMYHAVDDVLPHLKELNLWDKLLDPDDSKTLEDAKLLMYVKNHQRLHPKITAQRKISRTDIFEVLFGSDQDAKAQAHQAFDSAYQKYVSAVHPLEEGTADRIAHLQQLGVLVGVISNRKRDFLEHELALVDNGRWAKLFDVIVCGSDVKKRKPSPEMLLRALEILHRQPGENCWYVGDSTTDVIAAREAGVTSIFYNGAGWEQTWLDKIFPGTIKHPHRPDAVVDSIADLTDLARHMIAQQKRVERARS
ncbi:haloacid dehalogenase [Alcanivorax hongdengensis A-11-3]|uniref:phosphoglycolate phosphatase n=1 Tax=Alcanivorax hongdengensis A-11-3 TaxID=1177179 RepID=L0WFI9_9GAMM|nr:HAD family hydrolase [Alcanivorax hongdengensis]EKF74585.1 haloacid dehalogenase [Alcanivorax hongdengensis A-11-3]